jgi:hypothetical protein
MKQLAVALLSSILFAACSGPSSSAGTPAPPPEPEPAVEPTFNPAGVYDFTTEVEGQTVTGTLTLSGASGSHSGSITSDVGGMILRNISVDGMEVTFVGDMPEATVFFVLLFENETSFTGEWDAEGMLGYVTGTKR